MRRLIVTGGIIALAAFGVWVVAHDARFRLALGGDSVAIRTPEHVLILCDAETPAIYAVARTDSTWHVKRLGLEWR